MRKKIPQKARLDPVYEEAVAGGNRPKDISVPDDGGYMSGGTLLAPPRMAKIGGGGGREGREGVWGELLI